MNRILLLLDGKENRRLLAEWLAPRYEVLADRREVPAEPFDLGILDGPALVRLWDSLRARKEGERPVALPFLLITPIREPRITTPRVWEIIDELIRPPIEKLELQARVEALLRIRRLSLELHKRALDLSARLGRVLDDSPNEILIFDAGTLRIVQANQGASRNLGYSMEELLRLTPLDLQPEMTPEAYAALLHPLRTGAVPQVVFETLQRRKDGSTYPVEVRIQLSHTETPPVFVAVAQDITERKRVERELAEAHRLALRAEIEKRLFAREVLRAVTQDRFQLVERSEVPSYGAPLFDLPVRSGPEYQQAREAIRRAAFEAGMPQDRVDDLLLAAGEAIGNAIKHAVEGRCLLFRTELCLAVRVTDRGGGIRWEELPATILIPGFSTKVSLGMGYTLMLQLVDRIWLSTGPEGTIVQLEKRIEPEPEPSAEELLAGAMDRLASAW